MIRNSSLALYGAIGCAALAVCAGLWFQNKKTVTAQSTEALPPQVSAMDKVQAEILERSRMIKAHLESQKTVTSGKTLTQKDEPTGDSEAEILGELTGYVSCYADAATCATAPAKVTPENVRQTFEHLEARVLLEDLNSEDMMGNQILALVQLQPQFANSAIGLLQEFSDSASILKVYELTSLQPEHKAKLIEASLDPADESRKDELQQKSRELFAQMMDNGDPSDAFAASSVIRLFPDMNDEDYARLGQSLCRFSQGDAANEEFAYESLKSKLKRFVTNRKRLNSILSTCKG